MERNNGNNLTTEITKITAEDIASTFQYVLIEFSDSYPGGIFMGAFIDYEDAYLYEKALEQKALDPESRLMRLCPIYRIYMQVKDE